MTTTWRPRCSRGHYLHSKDVQTTLGPEDWDDTCRCKISPQRRESSTETFGHEPFVYDGVPICVRCFIQHRSFREAIAWPCTSAIVLGLTNHPTA